MARSVRLRLWAGLAAGAVIAAVPVAATAANASTGPGSNTLVRVTPGISAASVPGAVPFGTTPASTPETVSFVFKEQNLGRLEAAVTGGIKNYVSVGQFAREYGANPALISGLKSYLGKFGITTSAYADNVDVVANGTAGEFDQALAVTQHQYKAPAVRGRGGSAGIPAQTFHGTAQDPEVPAYIADSLVAILGLTDYSPFASQAVHANTSELKKDSSSSNACLALTGLPDGCNLPSNFASNYGLDKLYDKGADGSGQTLAIVTLAALDQGAPEYYWQNIAHIPATGRTVTVNNVDGGPGAPSDVDGTGETDLDVEQSGGVAPGANVIVYQAPNTDFGFADAFFDAASQNVASTVSSSWGESETYLQASVAQGVESPGYQAAFDEAYLEMAAQGQSGFVSSADEGAYTATGDLGTTNLSADTPADSPYITAAGGTTLAWSGSLTGPDGTATVNVAKQRTWGWDYLWQPVATITGESLTASAESQVVGSGGGYSTIEQRPSYQSDVPGIGEYHAVQYLTPTDYTTVTGTNLVEPTDWSFNPSPSVTSGYSSGRAIPDLSTDGDPYSGYLLYEPSAVQTGGTPLEGGWGGTSFVAPELNGSTAVIDSYLGHRVGLWNPSIYAFATSGNSPFTPLNTASTSNDNIYYTGNPGTVYNAASGLGFPNLSKLAADFASES
jgi:subtilase family serine protease